MRADASGPPNREHRLLAAGLSKLNSKGLSKLSSGNVEVDVDLGEPEHGRSATSTPAIDELGSLPE